MRLPYPERFSWKYILLLILALFLGQAVTGTNVYFSLLVSAYILLWVGAFNAAGGMCYTSGAFIFFTGMLVVIVGMTFKVTTGEAGESHLLSPIKTMSVYCAGMAGMWLAASLSRRLTPRRGLLANIAANETMMTAAIGCFIFGAILQVIFGSEYASSGTVGSAIRQFNRFPQVGILLATTYELNRSDQRRAGNWVVYAGVAWLFAWGVIYSSKEGMFIGPVTWILAAWAGGFNFKPKYLFWGGLFVWFMMYYMVPYSAYVRNFRDKDGSRGANQTTALEYIFKLGEVRKLALEGNSTEDYLYAPHLYNHEYGLIDRMSMMAYDDAIIDRTDQGYVFGLYPVYHAILNVVPRFFWHDKPFFFTANEYGRELAVIGEDDVTTGISFSPIADAYHESTWFAVLIVFPLIIFVYFLVTDSIVGSTKFSPWPLLPIALVSHLAPEGMVDGLILQITDGTLGMLIVAWTVRYIFPMTIRLLTGTERTVVRKTPVVKLGFTPLSLPGSVPNVETHRSTP